MVRTIGKVVLGLGFVGGGMTTMGQVQYIGPDGSATPTTRPFGYDRTIGLGDVKIPAGMTLEQAMETLRKRQDFNAVIVRDEAADKERPVLPAIELRNVSAPEIADVLSRVLENTVVTTNGSTFFFHVSRDSANPTMVKVFYLANETPAGASMKKFLDTAVSLVKAALDQAGGTKPVLQVHEETATLIVKGTRDQINLVQDTLNALKPNKDSAEAEKVARRMKELEDRSNRLQGDLDQAMMELRTKVQETIKQAASLEELQRSNQRLQEKATAAETQVRDQTREMVRLQTQLDELQKKLNPKQ